MKTIRFFIGLVAVAFLGGAAFGQEEAFEGVKAYKLGESRKPLLAVEQMVARAIAKPADRAGLAAKLAAVLSTDASYEAKDFCCRQLALVGTSAEVPALVKLLADEKLSFLGRFALERISDPAAGAALREALGTLKGNLQIGVISSIGGRRDGAAVEALGKLFATDEATALASAQALGSIGTPEAAKVLIGVLGASKDAARVAIVDALLSCGEQLIKDGKNEDAAAAYEALRGTGFGPGIRLAALGGLMGCSPAKGSAAMVETLKGDQATALQACGVLRQYPSGELTAAVAGALASLPEVNQIMVLDVLGGRDAAGKAAVIAAAKSDKTAIREAAIKALGGLGTAAEVPMLVGLLPESAGDRAAARAALEKIKDPAADKALIDAMGVTKSPAAFVEIVGALGARRASAAVPALLAVAKADADEKTKLAGIDALGQVATDADAPELVNLLLEVKSDVLRDATAKAIGAASSRMKDPDQVIAPIAAAIEKGDSAVKATLLGALARIGGAKALDAVRPSLKAEDAKVREAAMRAVTQWPDTAAVKDQIELIKGQEVKSRILAIRGLVSLIQRDKGLQSAEGAKLCKQMLEACTRPEDKRLVVAGAVATKHASALDLVLPLLKDEALKDEAASAVIGLARALGPTKNPGKAALQKVIDSSAGEAMKKQAADVMKKGK